MLPKITRCLIIVLPKCHFKSPSHIAAKAHLAKLGMGGGIISHVAATLGPRAAQAGRDATHAPAGPDAHSGRNMAPYRRGPAKAYFEGE